MADEQLSELSDRLSTVASNVARGLALLTREQYDGLRWSDTVILRWETTSALQLITHGRRILLAERPIDDELEALFAVLALGTERLLKVALGYAHLREAKGWPSHLGHAKRHRIAGMHRELLNKVERALEAERSDHEHVRVELQRLRDDRVLTEILTALESFATGGRFRLLDSLAGASAEREGAQAGWVRVLLVVEAVEPAPANLPEEFWMAHMNATAETSLSEWLAGLSSFAKCGLLGRRALSLASHIDEVATAADGSETQR